MAGVPMDMPRDEREGADAVGGATSRTASRPANRTATETGATSGDTVTAVSSDVYAASALGMVSTEWIDDAGVHSGDHAARAASAADAQAASNAGRRGLDLHAATDASGTAVNRASNTQTDIAGGHLSGVPVDQQGTLPFGMTDERGVGMGAGDVRGQVGARDDALIDTEAGGTAAAGGAIDASAQDGLPDARGVDVIVVGYGRVGREVVRTLTASGPRNIVVIEDRPDMHARLRDVHVRSVCGNAVQADVLLRAGLADARHLIVAIPNAFEAAEVIRQARHLAPNVRILARAGNTAEVQHLEAHGAHAVVIEKHEIARGLARELYDVA
ncbi:NAD(P)-binding protein [Robbsia sp. KACC 23696]|uniref:NAD(P)-binding protein n=1 Tax=Robbsia sp. KACC 23696 TaxID=3149231 RepID=UPI00325BDB07